MVFFIPGQKKSFFEPKPKRNRFFLKIRNQKIRFFRILGKNRFSCPFDSRPKDRKINLFSIFGHKSIFFILGHKIHFFFDCGFEKSIFFYSRPKIDFLVLSTLGRKIDLFSIFGDKLNFISLF